jgi:hypothetical protein
MCSSLLFAWILEVEKNVKRIRCLFIKYTNTEYHDNELSKSCKDVTIKNQSY